MLPDRCRRAVRWAFVGALMIAMVIVPFLLLEEPVLRFTGLLMNAHHRWALASLVVGLLAADVFLPIPSSIVGTGAGVLLGYSAGFAAAWLGLTLGCALGYWFGRTAGRALISRVVTEEELARAENLFTQFGTLALLICRGVPVMAEVSVIFAGISRMPLRTFGVAVASSNAGISAAYVAIGYYALKMDSFWLGLIGAIALPAAAGFAMRRILGRIA
ncbi:MAG: VTT domain-containing protein [Bryobacteraceae bacterium]